MRDRGDRPGGAAVVGPPAVDDRLRVAGRVVLGRARLGAAPAVPAAVVPDVGVVIGRAGVPRMARVLVRERARRPEREQTRGDAPAAAATSALDRMDAPCQAWPIRAMGRTAHDTDAMPGAATWRSRASPRTTRSAEGRHRPCRRRV